jgi:hypothetical protein
VTWKDGALVKDDRGSHWTISAKTREMEMVQEHFVAHLYHQENDFYELREVIFAGQKADNTEKLNGGLFWPPESDLIEIRPENAA